LPDRRKHRGAHPQDRTLFGPAWVPLLQKATGDLSWLLGRDYPGKAALKLVGDRYGLNRRQQLAVQRCACSDAEREHREGRRIDVADLRGKDVHIDGFNVLTTIEAALGGGVVLHARDGCFRDMASMHGTYRKVEETVPSLRLVTRFLSGSGVTNCAWYLDRPVANSGRLRALMRDEQPVGWRIEVVPDPDRILAIVSGVVATADSGILAAAAHWVNLARAVVETGVEAAWVVDLRGR
jgi:hypothetical protein